MKRFISSVLALSLVSCSHLPVAQAKDIGVEVWIKGSDIETPQRNFTRALRDSIEVAVDKRADMHLSHTGDGDVLVHIPNQVRVEASASGDVIAFAATISARRSQVVREISGSCKADDIGSCTDIIVEALRSF